MPTRRELANAIRFLAIDAIQKANSGHPGMPMGMADIAEVLWNDFLRYNPSNPHFYNRDRFILSNGHGSTLQYALLHLTGYDLTIEDIKQFRQWDSKTPGHPEVNVTPGIETTTGPLGQGLANGVGMALAEKVLAAQFNRDNFDVVDHHTYVFVGDGCLMEGISHEVCSLAGTLKLNKLTVFWDDNHISIDGDTKGWFTENVPERFESYHWHVVRDVDGQDAESVKNAIIEAQKEDQKPTLICCKTTIGFGSPNKAGKASSHGSPLGDDEIKLTREALKWNYAPFEIPADVYAAYDAKEKGAELEKAWQALFDNYAKQYPELAREFKRRVSRTLPKDWDAINEKIIEYFLQNPTELASRQSSNKVLEQLTEALPELMGGSADLSGSNGTLAKNAKSLKVEDFNANYIHYGVREMGMSSIMNGLALHDGFIPFGGTFLVFYNYAAGAVRMAAQMKQRVVFIYTHDSIGLGEDGPTHQPIEQIAQLRAVPGMSVWRPADNIETAVAWKTAIERQNGPTALLLSRQKLTALVYQGDEINQIKHGGYVIFDCENTPNSIIIASGSEVNLAVSAAKALTDRGQSVRVVSMPSIDVFLRQDATYQESVLPATVKARVAIEAGVPNDWRDLVGEAGDVIGMNRFGESAPADILFEEFGFTVENVINIVEKTIEKVGERK